MRLYYYRDPDGNFGDDMNAWLWPRLLPEVSWDNGKESALCGIGTIINERMPRVKQWIVFGSGAGYGAPPAGFAGPGWDILAVRGPMTARVLGLSPDRAITDGAMLLTQFPELQPVPEAERHGVVFVPLHYAAKIGRWQDVAARAGVEYLDPRRDSHEVIERIRTAKLILADSMHAAIVADIMRVPWIPLTTSNRINSFKWMDWSSSMAVPYEPSALSPSCVGERAESATLGLYGFNYRLANPTVEGAVAHFRRQSAMRQRSWWPRYSKHARRILTTVPTRLLSYPLVSRLAGDDDRLIDRAANALRIAAERRSYLSDTSQFALRKSEMAAGLDTLRSLVGSAS
jgi:succinoglycan biosynthesis protein ExoV